jgi:voltage-gated potassium channel
MNTEKMKTKKRGLVAWLKKVRKSYIYRDIAVFVNILFFLMLFLEFLFPDHIIFRVVEILFALIFVFELVIRFELAKEKKKFFLSFFTFLDLVILFSIGYRLLVSDSDILHIVSSLRILRAYHVFHNLTEKGYISQNRDVVLSAMNLLVFIFVMTSVVFVFQIQENPGIRNYSDALYFTITTLTTTGFGDITAVGTGGRMLTTVIMVFGAGLFFHLMANIYKPRKVRYHCKYCGLSRHETDASHCKHCGHVVRIKTRGF